MGGLSIWHWAIVLLVVLLLFGSGKISGLMGDMAKGIKAFRNNLKDDEKDASAESELAKPSGTLGSPANPGTTATRTPENASRQG